MSKKRIFENGVYKLSTGEKLSSMDLEKLISSTCHYVKYVTIEEDNMGNAYALVIPNKDLMANPDYKLSPEEGCFCPHDLDELGRCLSGCIRFMNNGMINNASMLSTAGIIKKDFVTDKKNPELESKSVDELFAKYRKQFRNISNESKSSDDEIYFIKGMNHA
jgi:hypothetical protein